MVGVLVSPREIGGLSSNTRIDRGKAVIEPLRKWLVSNVEKQKLATTGLATNCMPESNTSSTSASK